MIIVLVGKIEIICGSMFSGKSEELIRRLRRGVISKKNVLVFKPIIDTRYGEKKIISHNGNEVEAVNILGWEDFSRKEILEKIEKSEIIGFDEIQFFDKDIITTIEKLRLQGKRVIISGLDMDFKGRDYKVMGELLCKADKITKVNAICIECGREAYISYRKMKNEKRIILGGIEDYLPLCLDCYNKKKEEDRWVKV